MFDLRPACSFDLAAEGSRFYLQLGQRRFIVPGLDEQFRDGAGHVRLSGVQHAQRLRLRSTHTLSTRPVEAVDAHLAYLPVRPDPHFKGVKGGPRLGG